jgi:hypothetical protein
METIVDKICKYCKAKYEQDIAIKIFGFIKNSGSQFENWYVGITKDENQRNTIGRNVDINDKENYICINANVKESAYRVEEFFIEEMNTLDGKPWNGGDDESTYVYAINTEKFPLDEEAVLMLESTR